MSKKHATTNPKNPTAQLEKFAHPTIDPNVMKKMTFEHAKQLEQAAIVILHVVRQKELEKEHVRAGVRMLPLDIGDKPVSLRTARELLEEAGFFAYTENDDTEGGDR